MALFNLPPETPKETNIEIQAESYQTKKTLINIKKQDLYPSFCLDLVNKDTASVSSQNLNANNKDLEMIKELEGVLGEKINKAENDDTGYSSFSYCSGTTDYFVKDDKIVSLNIQYSGIKSEHLKIFNKLENLESLNLGCNRIKKIQDLDNLKNLKSLYLNNNLIENMEGLDKLFSLENLYLGNNKISKIEGVKKNKFLKRILLSNNLISEIQGLEESKNLECLNLYSNKVNNINGIQSYYNPNMTGIDLTSNKIIDASGIEYLLKQYPKMNIYIEGNYIGCEGNQIRLVGNNILKPPIDVLKKGREETLKYLEEKK